MDTSEKAELSEREVAGTVHPHGGRRSSRVGEIERIDAIALAPETTMESFAHLDHKKILRKVRQLLQRRGQNVMPN